MAFISKEELDKRLSESGNLLSRLNVDPKEDVPSRELDTAVFKGDGTPTGKPKYTAAQRAIIGATSILIGPSAAAEVLDVSPTTAKKMETGNHLVNEEDREILRESIYNELSSIRQEARGKLTLALGLISEETLKLIPDKDKAKIAAQMASQLSAVIDRTIQKAPPSSNTSHLHLYAPNQRKLDSFDIKTLPAIQEGTLNE